MMSLVLRHCLRGIGKSLSIGKKGIGMNTKVREPVFGVLQIFMTLLHIV